MDDDFSKMVFEVSEAELERMLEAIHKPMILSGYRFEVHITQVADHPIPGKSEQERLN